MLKWLIIRIPSTGLFDDAGTTPRLIFYALVGWERSMPLIK